MGATSTATNGRTRLENQLMDVMALHHEAMGAFGMLMGGVMQCVAADLADDPERMETRKLLAEIREAVDGTPLLPVVDGALHELDRSNGLDWRDLTLPAVRSGIQGLMLQLERNEGTLRMHMGRLYLGATPVLVREVARDAARVVRLTVALIRGWQETLQAAIEADIQDDAPLREAGHWIDLALTRAAPGSREAELLHLAKGAHARACGLDFGDATKERLLRSVNPLLTRLGAWIDAVEGAWGA